MNQQKKKFRPSLSTLILVGLVLGISVGLFFGEKAASLKIVGQAYIGLIQMSILPYMVVSLIGGIGQLSYQSATRLALTGGVVLLGSWVLAFFVIFLLPLAFPEHQSGSFYSPSLVQPTTVNFLDLYIPSNPFSSLARTIIPASAVFSVFLGVALIGVGQKESLVQVFTAISDTLTAVARIVVKLTPIGVFAIAANAAGTMTIDEFGRLQAYIITFVMATLLLTFWILPGLVAVLTPFRYRDVMRACRDALVTGFVTGNLFIVLPILIDAGKRLFEEQKLRSEEGDRFIEVLIPISFNFPNIGKLLTLLFILFAGWYTGNDIEVGEYPLFSTLGLAALFGGVDMALPFMLDQMHIPHDMYQLYVVTGVVNSWFATLIAVMNLFAFTLVATCAATGGMSVNWKRLLNFSLVSVIVLGAGIGLARLGLGKLISDTDLQLETLNQLELSPRVPAKVYEEVPKKLLRSDPRQQRLSHILERGTLRVGYKKDSLPFAFMNDRGELVGLDVQLYHELAMELGITLEFIPWTYDTLYKQLDRGDFELTAGGLIVSTRRLTRMTFSQPYMDITMALIVKDYQRKEITTWQAIEETPGFVIAVGSSQIANRVQEYLPQTEVVILDSFSQFFNGESKADALLMSAEAGSAWTILYPQYSVAIPEPHFTRPIAIAMAWGDQEFLDFVDAWLSVKKSSGEIDRLYNKWILGKDQKQKKPRWSIMRNVLHWGDEAPPG